MTRFQNIPPKEKAIGLCISLFLTFLLAYQFSFKKTIGLYHQYQRNHSLLEQAQRAPQQIQQHKTQLASLDQQISRTTYNRAYLFESLNTFCQKHNLVLSHFHPEVRRQENDLEIITNQIEVRGNYHELLALTYELEFAKSLGHIASIKFKKEKDKRNKKTYLQATIFLQNIEVVRNS